MNGQLIDDVSVGDVHLVHERRSGYFHSGGHRAHLQVAIHGGRAVRVYQHLCMRFSLESFLGKRHYVGARRNIAYGIRSIALRVLDHFQIGTDVPRPHGSVGHGRARGVLYGAGDAAQNILRTHRRAQHKTRVEKETDDLLDMKRR